MIAIIGGGISGLTLAYALQKAGKPYVLFESSSHTGGYIHSSKMGRYLIEQGPNSILVDSETETFIRDIGLEDELQRADPINKNRFVYKNKRIRSLPSGPLSLLFSGYFSFGTKKAILLERFKPKQSLPDESVYDFFCRRFSKELTEYAVVPFTTGIYAGDTRQLLMKDTFPGMYAFEQEYGSLTKGLFKKGFGSKRITASFTHGLQTLTDRLSSLLSSVHTDKKVTGISSHSAGMTLSVECTDGRTEEHYVEKLIFCTTAFSAGAVLEQMFPEEAALLKQVTYAPVKAFYAAFKRTDVQHPMNGFGLLYPDMEKQFIAGTIWNSSLFKGRCPEDEILTTSFIGGILHPEYTQLSDEAITTRALAQLKKDLGIQAEPTFTYLTGWRKAIPQYDLSLRKSKENLEMLKSKQIYFSSNWTNGIALGSCIQNAVALSLELY